RIVKVTRLAPSHRSLFLAAKSWELNSLSMHSESSQQGNGNMRGKFQIVGGTLFLANVLIVTSVLFIMKMHSNSNTPFPVWVVSGLERVGKTDGAETTSSISLSGARGETVDTQIVVQGIGSGLTNVN